VLRAPRRCEKPRQRGSVTRLHGGICAVTPCARDRRLVVHERARVAHWMLLRASRSGRSGGGNGTLRRRVPFPLSLFFEGLPVERSPVDLPRRQADADAGTPLCTSCRRAHARSRTENNNLVAVFGHRSIFYCDLHPGPKEGGCPTTEGERCRLTSLRARGASRPGDSLGCPTRVSQAKCGNGNYLG